jgi:hypothetical protein
MPKIKRLADAYRFPGFTPSLILKGIFGDQKARVIELTRLKKKQSVRRVAFHRQAFMTTESDECVICRVATPECIWILKSVASSVGGVTW